MIDYAPHLFRQGIVFLESPFLLLALQWWAALLFLTLAAAPFARRLLPVFRDGAWPFAKALGVLFAGYLSWLAAALGIAPFGRTSVLGSTALVALCGALFLLWQRGRRNETPEHIAKTVVSASDGEKAVSWKQILFSELLFLAAFLFWAWVRGFQPSIHGLEKFMDFGFVNAALRSGTMPPTDMWLAGEPINYYYFGHYLCAFLTTLTGMAPQVAYNLMLATLFGQTVTLAFSLGWTAVSLVRRSRFVRSSVATDKSAFLRNLAAGTIAALLVACGGNLHGFVHGHALPFLKNQGVYSGPTKSYWYPDATRYIGYFPPAKDKTIHEFPLYSFVVADLHGHVSDIPVTLTSLGVLLTTAARGPSADRLALGGFLVGIMQMTNSWDFPVHTALFGGITFVWLWRRKGRFFRALAGGTGALLATGALSLLVALPFLLRFQSFVKGIFPVLSRSLPWQLLVLWGDKLLTATLFLGFVFFLLGRCLKRRGPGRGFVLWWRALSPGDLFAGALCLAGIGLVAIPELVYVKDIYGADYHRANTMFKLGYQAFILWGIASGYVMVRLAELPRRLLFRKGLAVFFYFVVLLPLLYFPKAVGTYYPAREAWKGLDGLDFMNFRAKDDRAAIAWFNETVTGQVPLLEADGESYSDFGRISMATGLPTILGWHAHEWLWRNDANLPNRRSREVRAIYEAPKGGEAQELLSRYGIRYIVVGAAERKRFPRLDEDGLAALGNAVFRSGDLVVIEIVGETASSAEQGGAASPSAEERKEAASPSASEGRETEEATPH